MSSEQVLWLLPLVPAAGAMLWILKDPGPRGRRRSGRKHRAPPPPGL